MTLVSTDHAAVAFLNLQEACYHGGDKGKSSSGEGENLFVYFADGNFVRLVQFFYLLNLSNA